MVSESQIFRQIERLLVNRISLDAFEDWLVRSSWNMHLDSGSKAQSLVWKIELSLAEYSSEHVDVKELLAELKNLVPVWYVVDQPALHSDLRLANPVTTGFSVTCLDCSLFPSNLTPEYTHKPPVVASA